MHIRADLLTRIIADAAFGNGMLSPNDVSLLPQLGDKPVVIVAAAPRTGSTFLANVLIRVTGLRYFRLCPAYSTNEHDLYLPSLCLAKSMGVLSQMHIKGTFHNAGLMKLFGIRPIILVRRIFDIVVSLAHDLREKECLPGFGTGVNGYSFLWHDHDVKGLDDQRLLDLIIDLVVPWYVNYYVSWSRLCAQDAVEARWVRYEDMMTKKKDTVSSILDFLGLDGDMSALDQAVERKYATFNRGDTGRGDEMLSESQKGRIRRLFSYYPGTDFGMYGQ